MLPTRNTQRLQKEGRLALAIAALQRDKNLRVQRASVLYNVPRSTLRDRVSGTLPQATANAQKRKLHPTEEQSLVL